LITCKDALILFIKKLDIFRHNLLQGEFHQFPELLTVKNHITPEDIERFGNHLSELTLDMEKRFCDILNVKVYDWTGADLDCRTGRTCDSQHSAAQQYF